LQPANQDWLVIRAEDASAFAQFLYRADTRTSSAQKVGFKNCRCRTHYVVSCDFFDEARDIDVSGTSVRTGRVITEQAAIGFNGCLVIAQSGEQLSKGPARLGRRFQFLQVFL
jgi:hypothetical protein